MLANHDNGPLLTSKEQQLNSWRMGTGYHDPGSADGYKQASDRTYLVATVWGYNKGAKNQKTPEVSFGCLSGGAAYVPKPPPSTTTTTSTTSTAPTATPPPAPSSNVVYETFDTDMPHWRAIDGKFSVSNGQMLALNPGGKALLKDWVLGDVAIEADIKMAGATKPDSTAGLLFRVGTAGAGQNSFQGYYASVSNGTVVLGVANNDWKELAKVAASDVVADTSYRIRAEAVGDVISVYVGDHEQGEARGQGQHVQEGLIWRARVQHGHVCGQCDRLWLINSKTILSLQPVFLFICHFSC